MYQITGEIEGVTPILFNRPPIDLEKPSQGRMSQAQKLAEAYERLHKDSEGQIVLPRLNLKQSMLAGSQKAGLKVGRSGAWSYLEATVFVAADLSFGKSEPDFIHEHWGRIPPKTGAAVIIRRPAFDTGWRLPFILNVTDDARDEDQIRKAIETAGLYVGLGGWRPEYGRFILTDWKVIRNA